MTAPKMRKAANAGGQAAFLNASNNGANVTPSRTLKQRVKVLIVGLAVWGLIPAGFASWLIQYGVMRHE